MIKTRLALILSLQSFVCVTGHAQETATVNRPEDASTSLVSYRILSYSVFMRPQSYAIEGQAIRTQMAANLVQFIKQRKGPIDALIIHDAQDDETRALLQTLLSSLGFTYFTKLAHTNDFWDWNGATFIASPHPIRSSCAHTYDELESHRKGLDRTELRPFWFDGILTQYGVSEALICPTSRRKDVPECFNVIASQVQPAEHGSPHSAGWTQIEQLHYLFGASTLIPDEFFEVFRDNRPIIEHLNTFLNKESFLSEHRFYGQYPSFVVLLASGLTCEGAEIFAKGAQAKLVGHHLALTSDIAQNNPLVGRRHQQAFRRGCYRSYQKTGRCVCCDDKNDTFFFFRFNQRSIADGTFNLTRLESGFAAFSAKLGTREVELTAPSDHNPVLMEVTLNR